MNPPAEPALDYAAYVRRDVPLGVPRLRKSLSPTVAKSVHNEYLALTAVVRNGVDVAKRARADGFRARIEDLIVSGQAAEDGSLRVLRAALSKADRTRAQLRQEEKRVSRARAKMRIIEDSYLINDAPEPVHELQRARAGLAQLRLQAYCALRSQLQVERAIARLARMLKGLAALLTALTEEYEQVRGRRAPPPPSGAGAEPRPPPPPPPPQHPPRAAAAAAALDFAPADDADFDDDEPISSLSYNVLDGGAAFPPRTRSDMPSAGGGGGARAHPWAPDEARKTAAAGAGAPRARRRAAAGAAGAAAGQYGGAGAAGQGGSASRLFRSRLWGRPATASERADSELASVQDSEGASEHYVRSEPSARRERGIALVAHVRSSVRATRALSRFTMARVRLPSTAKKMWVDIDQTYHSILEKAPHLIEQRLVPLESIEDGLLGQWPQRERNVPGVARVQKMASTVDSAIDATESIASWQNSLVATIRVDYRKHRDDLRVAETQISDIYVLQLTGGEWTQDE